MMQPGIEAIGVVVLEREAGGRAKSGLAVEQIGIERALHQGIHRLANQVEGVWLEQRLQESAMIILIVLQTRIDRRIAGPVDEGRLEDNDVTLGIVGAVD